MKIHHTSALRAYSAALALFLAWAGMAGAQLPVTNGLRLWLAANTGVVTSGSSVTSWTDLSGNGNGVSQGTAANQPAFVTGGMNGLPVVRFANTNGAVDFYMESANAISSMISNNAYTAFAVFKVNTFIRNSASGYDNDAVFADTGGYFGLHVKSGGPSVYAYNYVGATDQAALVGATSNQTMLVSTRHELNSLYIDRLFGGSSVSNSAGNTQVLTGKLRLSGGFNLTNTRMNGDIAEILIYRRVLDADERGDVQEYLYTKWIIPEPTASALVLCGLAITWLRRSRGRFNQ